MRNYFKRIAVVFCCALILSSTAISTDSSALSTDNPSRVSVGSTSGGGSLYAGEQPVVSDDGRYVVFFGTASFSGAPPSRQLYKRDMVSGAIETVNVNNAGQIANNSVTKGNISADARYVIFSSTATNLVPNDTNAVSDVFVRDTVNDTTIRVSVSADGMQLSGASTGGAISDNGQYVAFTSLASNLVPNDTNGTSDVFKRDIISGEITRVSVTNSGAQAICSTAACGLPSSTIAEKGMSGDGRYVLFNSRADNLSTPTNGAPFGYLRDTQNNTTKLASRTHNTGTHPYYSNIAQTFSDDGRYVITSCSGAGGCGITPEDTITASGLYLIDLLTNTTSLASVNSSGVRADNIANSPQISDDGKVMIFSSTATNLVPDDTNGRYDIFSRDFTTNEVKRLSVTYTGGQANGHSNFPSVSSNGRFVAYHSESNNLLASPVLSMNAYLYDRLPIPAAPLGLTAASPTNQAPVLSWQASQSAGSYTVYRNGQAIGSSSATQFTDNDAPEGVSSYTVSAVNSAGESPQSSSVSVLVDRTDPTISYTIAEMPNNFGWNKSGVTVTFNCSDSDDGSGVANCSSPVNFLDDGEGQTAVGSVTDNAGNSASVTATVNIDSALPTISSSVSPNANSLGWHNSDPTINFECADALSGLNTCTEPIIVSDETDSQDVSGTASDKAGNEAAVAKTIKLDKTAPIIAAPTWTANPKPTNGTATMSLAVTESLSGLSEAEYFLGDTDPGIGNGATMQTVNTDGALVASTTFNTDFPTGVYKVSVRAKDAADNWSTVATDYLVVYNPVGPRMTGKQTILPSLSNGDLLPGLNSATQTDTAKFGFSVKYDSQQQISANSDFQFSYNTGTHCNSTKPNNPPQNCHQLELNSSSISWLTTQGQNGSEGIFQGTGTLIVDGVSQQVAFRVTGLDGERLDTSSPDRFALSIFALGDNPSSATPIYKVTITNITRGNVKIMDQ